MLGEVSAFARTVGSIAKVVYALTITSSDQLGHHGLASPSAFPDPFDASIPPRGPSVPYVSVIVGTDNHSIPQSFLGARGKTDDQIFNYRYEHIA
jgi:hypothetical protein